MNKPRNDLWKVQKHFSDGKVTVTPARRQSTTGTNNFTEDAPASRTQLLTISLSGRQNAPVPGHVGAVEWACHSNKLPERALRLRNG